MLERSSGILCPIFSLPSPYGINTPGTPEGNWQWRLTAERLTPALTKKIADMTELYGRSCY